MRNTADIPSNWDDIRNADISELYEIACYLFDITNGVELRRMFKVLFYSVGGYNGKTFLSKP